MTSPSDTPPIARTITARVHDNAIARVPKLFTDSLAAIFTELLQNARRAEATRLYINTGTTPRITPPNPAAHCITVADDGTGIADPAILLSFGETGWDNATATREDAAGMGIAALARRGCTVHSASRTTPAWRVTLTPAHFLGRESAPVHLTSTTGTQPYPNGTEITFAAPEDLPAITKALTSAARYYPLPVYLNGEQLVRHAFLHDAIHTETWQGATFGVFTHHYPYTNTPDLNFHGLCLNARLPRVDTIAGHTWTVRADVQDCPQLELVLPARNEPVETPFLDNLRCAARAAIYRAIATANPAPRMAYTDVQKAWALAITLPFPPHELPRWQPEAAHDHHWHHTAAVYHPTGAEPLLMTAELEPHDAQTFHRAAVRAGIADRLLEPRTPFDGFRWYGNIPRIRQITARITTAGITRSLLTITRTGAQHVSPTARPDAISLHVLIEHPNGTYESFDLPADVVFAAEPYAHPGEITPLVTTDSDITPPQLTGLLNTAFFTPSDDCDADSWSTQEERFNDEALALALTTLVSKAEAHRQTLIDAVHREITWRLGPGEDLQITIRNRQISIEPAPDPAP